MTSIFFRTAAWRAVLWLIVCALLAPCAILIQATPAFAAGHAKAARPPAPPPAPPPLRIGEINTYKALPGFSEPYRRGWTLALEQINAEGGVLGRKLEVRSHDDHGDPDDAVKAAQALVEKDDVVALFGGYSSEVALALSSYADTNRVLYLAVAPLDQRLTWQQGNRYTFRLRPAAWMQAAAVAPKALGLRKLRWALIYQDTASDRATADAFKGLFKTFQAKTEIVAEQVVTPGKFDAKSTVEALVAARPDAIFNTLTGRELVDWARAGVAAHLFDGVGVVSLFMGDPENLEALDTAMLVTAAPGTAASAAAKSNTVTPNAATSNTVTSKATVPNATTQDSGTLEAVIPDGWIITGYPRDAIDAPENQAFVQAYRERYGDAPDTAAVLGYAAMRSIAEGLKRAGTPDRETVAMAFPRLQVPTPFGTIEYRNLDHQSTLGVYLGYTGHADGRLAMERFVYATGARLQPLDDQIRRLRAQTARANASNAANGANGVNGANGANSIGTANTPANTVHVRPATDSAHPVTGAARPMARPDTELSARLRAARPGAAPAAGTPTQGLHPEAAPAPASGHAPASAPAPASTPSPAPVSASGTHAQGTQVPIQTTQPAVRALTPAMGDWPDQVGQPGTAH
jgi:ABC-type branched-subunit amino acid transport system substrate-binding protein